MNFDDFRIDIEAKLKSIAKLELLEYQYMPYHFGSGVLAYRAKGYNHKFVFDGRDNLLVWFKSRPHENYSQADFKEVKTIKGLNIAVDVLLEEMNKV